MRNHETFHAANPSIAAGQPPGNAPGSIVYILPEWIKVYMIAASNMTIPVVILFLTMQKYLERGLTAGGVKG